MFWRVPAVHAAAGEIYKRFRAVDRLGPIAERRAIPMQVTDRGLFAMRAASQDHDLIAFADQNFRERLPEKSAASGENDPRFHVRTSGKRQAPLSHERREAISR